MADVLDHEFQHTGEGTPCFASDSNFSVARCIRSSLSYGVKDVKESDTNRELMLKLSAHSIRAAVASKVIDKQDCDEKQLESCALNLSLKDAKKSKHNDKTELHNAVDNDSGISDAPRDDVASGQRIKFLLQDQKVIISYYSRG